MQIFGCFGLNVSPSRSPGSGPRAGTPAFRCRLVSRYSPSAPSSAVISRPLGRRAGQTFGIAVIGSLITWREKFHSAILVDSLSNANAALADRFNGLVETFLGASGDRALAELQAWKSLSGTASTQAYALAFADSFVIIAAVLAVSAVLVLMLPPLRERMRTPSLPAPANHDALASERRI